MSPDVSTPTSIYATGAPPPIVDLDAVAPAPITAPPAPVAAPVTVPAVAAVTPPAVADAASPVLSVVMGNNADLIKHIAPLYIPNGSVVRDVTWGRGAFWTKIDRTAVSVVGSDIDDRIGGHGDVLLADFRQLPDEDASADVVVLDPPYIHNPGVKGKRHTTDDRYNNAATTAGMSHNDIRALYGLGMSEALRVLRPGGRLMCKGKDEIESGRQCWSSRELAADAEDLGFYCKDFVILVPSSRTPQSRWSTQKHIRKVHSFLWVFEKPVPKVRRNHKVVSA